MTIFKIETNIKHFFEFTLYIVEIVFNEDLEKNTSQIRKII